MKIAIDATPLEVPSGGIARYTSELVRALANAFPEDEFVLLSDRPFEGRAVAPGDSFLDRRWWTYGLPRTLHRQGADVFHGVAFAVPFPAVCPAVMTIHDLSPWREDSWVDDAWRARTARVRKRVPWLLRLRAATEVITPSEAVRQEVLSRFGLEESKVTAVPLAAAEGFGPREQPPASSYFLFAGMWEARKNVEAVIAAWEGIRREFPAIDLVIAGPRRAEWPLPAARQGLRMVGEVPDEEVAELYRGAAGFIYLSRYEGFGLPVLEAMQSGCPVVISGDGALRETAGGAALVARDNREVVEAMRALVSNPEMRGELRARSLRRAAHFSWDKTARRTHEVYSRVVAR